MIDVVTPSANDGPVPASTDAGTGTILCSPSERSGEEDGLRAGAGTGGVGGVHADMASANAMAAVMRAAELLLPMGAIIIARGGEDTSKTVARSGVAEASLPEPSHSMRPLAFAVG